MIYCASPYSDPDPAVRLSRFESACRFAAKMMQEGHLIFSPIAHTHPIALAGELPTGWDFWERYDRDIIQHCSEVWVLMLPGWKESKGVAAELKLAHVLGKPVTFWRADETS